MQENQEAPSDKDGAGKTAPKDTDDTLSKIRQRFAIAQSAWSPNQQSYVDDVKFSSSADQWDEQAKKMRGEGRPALTFNRLNGIVKQLVGDYRQNKLSLKVLPASGDASVEKAELMAGLIRNIEAQSNADMAYTNAFENAVRGGFGFFRILSRYSGDDVFDQDLVIEPIYNPLTVYFDPMALKITREDANWCIVTEMISSEQFKRLYPKAKSQGFTEGGWHDTDGIRVAEYYEKVRYTARLGAFSNGMVVEITDEKEIDALAQIGFTLVKERQAERTKISWKKVTESEILDEREYKIRYIPVIPVIGDEVNVEGKVVTRSAIHYAKHAQQMLNYQKTAAVELTALAPKAPFMVTPAMIEGFTDEWDNANTTPLAYLPYNPDPAAPQGPQRVQPNAQQIAEISIAGDMGVELQYTSGVFDTMLGQKSNESSGVAMSERQNQGATNNFIFTDNLKQSIEYGGRVLLDWIPQTYDAERVIRILDMEGNPKTETVNEQTYNPMTGIIEILNNITVGKYDIVIDTGPNFASRRKEALAAAMDLAKAYPPVMQAAGDLIVGLIDAPGMEQVADRIKRSMPPQLTTDPDSPEGKALANQPPPVPPEVQAEQAKLQTQTQLEQVKLQGQLQLEQAKAQIAAQADQQRARTDAQLANAQQSAQARQEALAQQEESRREILKLKMEMELKIKEMLLDHKLDLQTLALQNHAKLQQIHANTHADMHKNAQVAEMKQNERSEA